MDRRQFLKLASVAASAALLPRRAGAATLGTPTLPQYDSLTGSIARQAQLAATRLVYTWTYDFPDMPGVPKQGPVMAPTELQSAEWSITEAQVIASVTSNILLWLASNPTAVTGIAVDQVPISLQTLETEIASSQSAYSAITAALPASAPLAAGVAAQLQSIVQSLQSAEDTLFNELKTALQTGTWATPDGQDDDYVANYRAMFVTQPLPEVASGFRDDALFARLRVAGFNPVMLQRLTALPTKLPITQQQFAAVLPDDSLSSALRERRLYVADYADMGGLAPPGPIVKEESGTGYAYKPIALFAVPRGDTSLVPVAIQCGQDPSHFPLFFPAASGEAYWAWQMAKTVVQHADFNHHELYTHLGRTHILTEAFAVAAHRQLAEVHPLYALLLPHFEGTISINSRGAVEILAPKLFAEIGLAPQLSDGVAALLVDRLAFDFNAHLLPNDIAARGVDDVHALPDYPYRDDGLLVWNAIAAWVNDYVNLYYASDLDVQRDTEVAAWITDAVQNGKVAGLAKPGSKAQLVQLVAGVIFNASAQHAAVNYPQLTMMTYVPSSSGVLSAQAPAGVAGQSETTWRAMLPPPVVTVAQVIFLSILGSLYYKPLGGYRSATLPVGSAFTDGRVAAPLARFQAALADVEATITARNATRAAPYTVLLPSKIPTSTNI
jgi:arachidonate 15-lipoxygenase